MFIKSATLINIRSFKREKIEFSKNINLLIGKNNTGKSTIIKSLYKLQRPHVLEKNDVRKDTDYAKVYIDLVELDDRDKKLFNNKENPSEKAESDKQTIIYEIFVDKNIQNQQYYFDTNLEVKYTENDRLELKDEEGYEIEFLKEFKAFPLREDQNNFIYPFLSKRNSDYYLTRGGSSETYNVEENLRHLAPKIQKICNPSHPQNEDFRYLCKDILDFEIGTIPYQDDGFEVGIYTSSTETISLRSMGEGVANILGLIVILLTEDNKLYLIEELENDIHPGALKKLLNLIISKSKSNQFVISTHSNIVVKYLGSESNTKLFYLEWSPKDADNNVKSQNVPTSIIKTIDNSLAERIQILEKLGYDFYDFEFYESYLILEESSAEQIIRSFLIPAFTPSLSWRLKTIAAKGVADIAPRVIDFNRLFVFLHGSQVYYKKVWVVADGDKDGIDCIKLLKENFKSWPGEHFHTWSEPNFELYYPQRFQDAVKTAFNIKDRKKRQEAKSKVLKDVIEFTLNDRDQAIMEFEISSKEIIEKLKAIELDLNSD